MIKFKNYVFIAAVISAIVSILIHILCIAGYTPLTGVKAVWVMHVIIFPVWGYAIWYLNNLLLPYKNGNTKPGIVGYFKIVFKGLPVWVGVLGIVLFYYAPVNFVICMLQMPGTPAIIGGQYVLHNHGKDLVILTQQQYYLALLNELRMFSGNWIAFYSTAVVLLYPRAGEGGAITVVEA